VSSENSSSEDKTEEPSQRRLEDAFKRGDFPHSREILHWSLYASSFLLILAIYPLILPTFLSKLRSCFEIFGTPDSPLTFITHLKNLYFHFSFFLSLLLIIVAVILLVGLTQSKMNISAESLKPKFEKISPMSGFKRIYGKKAIGDFLKNFLKMIIVIVGVLWFLWPYKKNISLLLLVNLSEGIVTLEKVAITIFITILCILGLIALLDYLHIKFQFMKRLRMTRQEVKDEHKEQEGSPQIKSRLREIRIQRLKSQIASRVKKSTVIVTNPTHYAIALFWEQDVMDAPIVLAKGVDFMAQAIRRLAKDYNVPIVENPPLARTLYDTIEVDKEILPEHYKAVAEVIRYVMKLKNQAFR
jgi:flagellar biosynthetic protein FlhB